MVVLSRHFLGCGWTLDCGNFSIVTNVLLKNAPHFHALVIITYLLLTVLLETDKMPQSQRYLAIL